VHRFAWLVLGAALAVGLMTPAPAQALPVNPWTGRWDSGSGVVTLTQIGSQISGSGPCPGAAGSDVKYGASASGNGSTANFSYSSTVCTGTGGTFALTLDPTGQTARGSGVTQYGTGFSVTWTYLGGGNEPRSIPPPPPQGCPTPAAPWTGYWNIDSGGVLEVVQSGAGVTGVLSGGESDVGFTGTASGNALTGVLTDGERISATLTGPTAFTGTAGVNGNISFNGRLQGCASATPPNLGTTIPSPQTLTNGPTSLVAPGKISLRSLKRSKCVLVKVSSRRPARILVSIFSGRRSIRLFGQKLVVFFASGTRQPCITVPFRAHTFNVRTPLRVALGYTAGARPQRGGRKPPPVIRPIKLVP
jgi:hypothetical protein